MLLSLLHLLMQLIIKHVDVEHFNDLLPSSTDFLPFSIFFVEHIDMWVFFYIFNKCLYFSSLDKAFYVCDFFTAHKANYIYFLCAVVQTFNSHNVETCLIGWWFCQKFEGWFWVFWFFKLNFEVRMGFIGNFEVSKGVELI